MARVSENCATTCCVAELTTVTEIGRPVIAPKPVLLTLAAAGSTIVSFTARAGKSALPRLFTAALKAIGSPKGTGFGVALTLPVRPDPPTALDATVKLALLEARSAPSASRRFRA